MEQTNLFADEQTTDERNEAAEALKRIETAAAAEKYRYFKTEETATAEKYPYGRLTTSATFGTEYRKGKGFRTTFQTINPKTGRINNVKRSTYSELIIMKQDKETNFISYDYASLYDYKGTKKFLEMLTKHFSLLTKDQVKDLSAQILARTKQDIIMTLTYSIKPENRDKALEKMKSLYNEAITLLTKIYRTQENLFAEVLNAIDFEQLKTIKDEGYNPFRTTETYIIGANGMQKVENEEN